jgi:chromosome segregation ATPase
MLQEQRDQLRQELNDWKEKAESEFRKRHVVQGEVDRLLDRIKQAEEDKQSLEQQVDQWKRIADNLLDSTAQCHEGANKILKALGNLKSMSSSYQFCSQLDASTVSNNVEY